MLWGREADQAAVGAVLDRARAGRSAVLVVRGDPGIGKSALLEDTAAHATGMTVLRCAGVETEAEVPFASLHQLLAPALTAGSGGAATHLPDVQAAALRGALGLGPSAGGDQLLVGVAVLTLLAELAEDGPVLCLVDDAHWLDRSSAQALRFVARRLQAESVAMVFGARDEFALEGLPEHRLAGLDDRTAGKLLKHLAPDLPRLTRRRVVRDSAGNPLALRELPRTAGEAFVPGPLPARIQDAFAARIRRLPPDGGAMLLIAAADDELGPVLRAADLLEVSPTGLAAAEEAGLVTVGAGRIAFTHPLLRAAAYQRATFDRRLAAHRALAEVRPAGDDRRAWHLAAAATGPDEEAALALAHAAERARGRKGHAATAAALRRSAELTADPATRTRRLIAAAVAANDAGQPDLTRELLEACHPGGGDPRWHELQARIAFDEGSAADAHELLVAGAAALAPTDRAAAGLLLVDAARNAWQLSDPPRVQEAATLLHGLDLRPQDGLDPAVAAVTAAARLLVEGPAAGVPAMRELTRTRTGPPNLRLNAAFVAGLVGDFEAGRTIARGVADECRAEGAVGWLPLAHVTLAAAELYLGRFRDAEATASEGLQLAADTGQPNRAGYLEGILAWIAAIRGDTAACRELAGNCVRQYTRNHIVNGLAWAEWARALLDLGLGQAAAASDRLATASAGPVRHQIQAVYFAPDQVEAATLIGDHDRAGAARTRFAEWAGAAGLGWSDAVLHRCNGLMEPSWPVADSHFAAAVAAHATSGRPWETARTHLAYGERLRRERRKSAARGQLRTAAELFERLDARPWADRARAELRAAGDQTAAPTVRVLSTLTPQELQIVRLVAAGLTNREVGAQLFLSPKTVSYHLYRAFPKLNVASRTQLARLDLTG